jgi:hypothetical protein
LGCVEEAVSQCSAHALMKEQKKAAQVPLSVKRIKRQYVWAKSSGLCWYCGAQLYSHAEADTAVKNEFIFTADHVHPRKYGGRGRANKVPACKYCNSTRVHGVSKNFGSGCEPDYLTIASHSAIKYWGAGRSTTEVSFSISSLSRFANRVSRSAIGDRARHECTPQDVGRSQRQPHSSPKGSSLS